MKRTVLVFGLVSGVIISAFMATSMAIAGCSGGTPYGTTSMVISYAAMLIAFSFIFIGIKSYRDKHLGGTMTFGQGAKTGLLIAAIAATMYVITWSIEYHFFLPDFMDTYSQHMITEAQNSGKSATEIAAEVKQMEDMKEMYKNPFWFILFTYMEILPIGIIVALISAAILKRKPKQADTVVA
jgi:hypothetical protein